MESQAGGEQLLFSCEFLELLYCIWLEIETKDMHNVCIVEQKGEHFSENRWQGVLEKLMQTLSVKNLSEKK